LAFSQVLGANRDIIVTKYYKAKVELRQFVEVEVAAETEADARQKAKEIAIQRVPSADAWAIELFPQGEAHFNVGSRVNHALFGPGEIVSLIRTAGQGNNLSFRATVKFDSGDKKDLHLPHASVKPAAFGA